MIIFRELISTFSFLASTITGGGSLQWNSSFEARFNNILPILKREIPNRSTRALVAGIIWTESAFDPNAINGCRPPYSGCTAETGIARGGSGAQGLMQIMPFHNGWLGWGANSFRDPAVNIRAGMQVLKDQGFGKKNIDTVLAGYGGFITVDPTQYVERVLIRASYMYWRV